jgi:hypothetical protein
VSHWQIGDVRITKFVEKEFAGSVHRFSLLDAIPEACKDIAWLTGKRVTGKEGKQWNGHRVPLLLSDQRRGRSILMPTVRASTIPALAKRASPR